MLGHDILLRFCNKNNVPCESTISIQFKFSCFFSRVGNFNPIFLSLFLADFQNQGEFWTSQILNFSKLSLKLKIGPKMYPLWPILSTAHFFLGHAVFYSPLCNTWGGIILVTDWAEIWWTSRYHVGKLTLSLTDRAQQVKGLKMAK